MADELSTTLEALLLTDIKASKKMTSISELLEVLAVSQGKNIDAVKNLEPFIKAMILSSENSNKSAKNIVAEIKNLIAKEIPALDMKGVEKSLDNIKSLIENAKSDKISVDKIESLLKSISEKKTETVDLSSVVKGLESVKNSIDNIETPEPVEVVNNSELLKKIVEEIKKIEINPQIDQRELLKLLKKISERKHETHFGGGGGGSTEVVNIAKEQINPSTSDNQSTIIDLLTSILSNVNTHVDGEVPTGTIDGANKVFTLANTPNPVGSLQLIYNGLHMTAGGEDYSLTGSTITYNKAPRAGRKHITYYRK